MSIWVWWVCVVSTRLFWIFHFQIDWNYYIQRHSFSKSHSLAHPIICGNYIFTQCRDHRWNMFVRSISVRLPPFSQKNGEWKREERVCSFSAYNKIDYRRKLLIFDQNPKWIQPIYNSRSLCYRSQHGRHRISIYGALIFSNE